MNLPMMSAKHLHIKSGTKQNITPTWTESYSSSITIHKQLGYKTTKEGMYNCNANYHPSVHSLQGHHRTCMYLCIRVCVYTIWKTKSSSKHITKSMYCAVLCCAAPFLSSQLPLIHAHSTITLCLLRNGDSRENDREAETVNKHSEHSTTKCKNKFTQCSFSSGAAMGPRSIVFVSQNILLLTVSKSCI